MSEPRLEDIEDYDTLKGKKKHAVLIVVLSALFIGLVTYGAYLISDKEESIEVEQTFKQVPMK